MSKLAYCSALARLDSACGARSETLILGVKLYTFR